MTLRQKIEKIMIEHSEDAYLPDSELGIKATGQILSLVKKEILKVRPEMATKELMPLISGVTTAGEMCKLVYNKVLAEYTERIKKVLEP